ncbi:hypothetical protein ACHQM5_024835 [Ranunculus cassubicifolius]
MNKKPVKQENTFIKVVKAPIRFLGKARDLYVNSLTNCSGRMNYGGAFGPANTIPRSYSNTSARSNDSEDLRELVRAASQRGLREKLEMEIKQQRQASKKLPRSFTVGIQRIDEDKPFDFPEEDFKPVIKKKKADLLFPRSKSAAVSKRTNLYA